MKIDFQKNVLLWRGCSLKHQALYSIKSIKQYAQSLKFELPPWISCLFTACTALLGGRNKPNYLTKVQQDANGTLTGCSSILWLITQQLSFLIPSDPSWGISLYFYPSQRSLALSLKNARKSAGFFKRKIQCGGGVRELPGARTY